MLGITIEIILFFVPIFSLLLAKFIFPIAFKKLMLNFFLIISLFSKDNFTKLFFMK